MTNSAKRARLEFLNRDLRKKEEDIKYVKETKRIANDLLQKSQEDLEKLMAERNDLEVKILNIIKNKEEDE